MAELYVVCVSGGGMFTSQFELKLGDCSHVCPWWEYGGEEGLHRGLEAECGCPCLGSPGRHTPLISVVLMG